MSTRSTNSNRSNRTDRSTRTGRSTNTRSSRSNRSNRRDIDPRPVFDPSAHETGVYRREHKVSGLGMGIRREDTRHGGTSNVVVWRPRGETGQSQRFVLTLAEARSLNAFLNRELEVRAR